MDAKGCVHRCEVLRLPLLLRGRPFWKGRSTAARRRRCLHPSERQLAPRPMEDRPWANKTVLYASVTDYRLQRVRLVIGHAFSRNEPMILQTVTCDRAIGASRHPCDEVHRASQRAAAPPEEGVVGARWIVACIADRKGMCTKLCCSLSAMC